MFKCFLRQISFYLSRSLVVAFYTPQAERWKHSSNRHYDLICVMICWLFHWSWMINYWLHRNLCSLVFVQICNWDRMICSLKAWSTAAQRVIRQDLYGGFKNSLYSNIVCLKITQTHWFKNKTWKFWLENPKSPWQTKIVKILNGPKLI